MGKRHRLQKKVKSEKGKTKLKAKSKFLPKGTNVTNAEFKVKQIIVPSQLTLPVDASDGQRNLDLKELLKKLKHHNEKFKINACEDLSYFITNQKDSIQDLYLVIEGLSQYIQEQLPKPRKAGLNTINTLLQSFTERDIDPHFHYFSVNIRCAMTHIDKKIREDSLLFLDAFLMKCPKLVSKYCNELLPNFLMLISDIRNQSTSERSLSINLKSSVTSTQWRISVLSRLYSIIEGAISYRNSIEKKETKQCPTVKSSKVNQYTLFKTWKSVECSNFSLHRENESDVHKHLVSIFPLLLGIWLEGAPSKTTSQDVTYLSEESSMLLNCITKVLHVIVLFLEHETRVVKSAATLIDCLFQNLPYRLRDGTKQMTKSKDKFLKLFHTNDINCFQQNSSICYFYLLLHSDSQRPSKFLHSGNIVNIIKDFCDKDCISSNVDVAFLMKLLQLLLVDQPTAWKANNTIISNILREAINLHRKQLSYRGLDNGLLKILSNIRNTQLTESEDYIDWLEYLPRRFLQQTIHESDINILLNLSSRGPRVEQFNQAYMKNLGGIAGHLDDLIVVDVSSSHNAKLKILDILFYAAPNDEDTCILLRSVLGEESPFWPHVVKIFSLKRYMNSNG